jgi:sugar/nucleoside kinase (ribokinase family)
LKSRETKKREKQCSVPSACFESKKSVKITDVSVQTFHSSQRRGLLAGGNWIVDHVKMIDVWPSQDALANITKQSDGNGGGPYNVTKNLAKLGCDFPLAGVGLIGRDADGETILRDCAAHGIAAAAIQPTSAAPTSYTDVMTVSSTGRRTFFHQHGANALLDLPHFDLTKTSARIFYLGYLCLLRTLDAVDETGRTKASRLFEQARATGMTTVADLVSNESGDFSAIVNPSLPHLDFLFLNEYELTRLVGGSATKNPIQLESQARAVLQRGVHGAVIVHLPEGAVCVAKNQPAILQPSVRVPANLIVGTVGAGDAFSAGFLLGLHEGWDFPRRLELAVCAAAASLRDATCSAAVESWQNCLALGRQMGFHTGL